MFFLLAKKIIFAFSLIVFYDQPHLSMLILTLLSVGKLALAFKQPLLKHNKKEILCDILVFIINLLFSTFLFQDKFTDNTVFLIGFIVCGCTVFTVFVQLAFVIKDSIQSIKEIIQSIRKKLTTEKEKEKEKKNEKKRKRNRT